MCIHPGVRCTGESCALENVSDFVVVEHWFLIDIFNILKILVFRFGILVKIIFSTV